MSIPAATTSRPRAASISVLIPTAREAFPKRGTLGDLLRVCVRRLPIAEVIVAGRPDPLFLSGRTDLKVPVRVLRDANIERNHLRNRALQHARGSHVMLLDDDTIVVPHRGLRSAVSALKHSHLLTFAERVYLPIEQSLSRLCTLATSKGWGPSIRTLPVLSPQIEHREWYSAEVTFPTNFCIGASDFVRRIGGLDESFIGWGYEDVDFANRVLASGVIQYCRNTATAIHIDHLVHPDQQRQAQLNYSRFLRYRATNRSQPCISANLFGIAGRYLSRMGPVRSLGERAIDRCLLRVKHFESHPADLRHVCRQIDELTPGIDTIALTVYGSAMTHEACRDVDLCIVAGHCADRFLINRMPSGKEVEIHLTSLAAVSTQLRKLFYLGDNAYLLYFKFKTMRFLYDYRGIARRYLHDCLREDVRIIPYMTSLYIGLAYLSLEKRHLADQLALGRHVAAIAMISGTKCPPREAILSPTAARKWLQTQVSLLAPRYCRAVRKLGAEEWLLYPPNFRGHDMLVSEGALQRRRNTAHSGG